MPQNNDKQNQKPGMKKPDMDQKTPQSDQGGIGREHGFEKEKSSMKPEVEKGTNAKPDRARNVSKVDPSKDLDDKDDENEVDDDDDRITQRSPARESEPQRK